ncbi:MAG: hypothetical protein R3C53_15585 [Pirellulaceae bacterium]
MATKAFSKQQDKSEYYARQWYASLANYHCIMNRESWQFCEEDVIAFLKMKVGQNMPTWQRLGIVNSLIWYRNNVRKTDQPSLERVRAALQERVAHERLNRDEVPIEDVVGKINPREPDVIQQFRRQLRLHGRALNTEKAYVQKLRASRRERVGSLFSSDRTPLRYR